MRVQYVIISIMMVLLLIGVVIITYRYSKQNYDHAKPLKLPIIESLNYIDYIHDKIYLDKSPVGGRGVFAKEDIREGDIIEIAPIILEELHNILSKSTIMNYVFYSDTDEDEYAIAFGYGSMYNHNDNNNAAWTIDRDALTITFTALSDIPKGSEIFVSYGDSYWDSRHEEPN